MNKKYRKKPVEVYATQFDPNGIWPACVIPWGDDEVKPRDCSWGYIDTLEGRMHVQSGDWIIKGVRGEFYPCKPDIFKETYEEANHQQTNL